jgi:hypothetical protein
MTPILTEPWIITLEDATVRQAVNRLAAHMVPHGSWIFYGSEEFREVAFFNGVEPYTTPAWLSKLRPGAAAPVVSNPTLHTASFTTRVAGGTATFTAIVTSGSIPAGDLPITFTGTRFAPANPSNVSLAVQSNDATHKQCTISGSARACSVTFPVVSCNKNKKIGTVTWIFLYGTNSRDAWFSTSPNPLRGTVTLNP